MSNSVATVFIISAWKSASRCGKTRCSTFQCFVAERSESTCVPCVSFLGTSLYPSCLKLNQSQFPRAFCYVVSVQMFVWLCVNNRMLKQGFFFQARTMGHLNGARALVYWLSRVPFPPRPVSCDCGPVRCRGVIFGNRSSMCCVLCVVCCVMCVVCCVCWVCMLCVCVCVYMCMCGAVCAVYCVLGTRAHCVPGMSPHRTRCFHARSVDPVILLHDRSHGSRHAAINQPFR